jgi:alpha-methylacyl-CoA racemase
VRRVRGELQAIFEAQTSEHWTRLFHDVDCCVTVVLTLEEAIAREQTQSRKMVLETEYEGTGKFLEFAPPLKMSDLDLEPDAPCSREETRTEEILSAAGYSIGQIEDFRRARLVA